MKILNMILLLSLMIILIANVIPNDKGFWICVPGNIGDPTYNKYIVCGMGQTPKFIIPVYHRITPHVLL